MLTSQKTKKRKLCKSRGPSWTRAAIKAEKVSLSSRHRCSSLAHSLLNLLCYYVDPLFFFSDFLVQKQFGFKLHPYFYLLKYFEFPMGLFPKQFNLRHHTYKNRCQIVSMHTAAQLKKNIVSEAYYGYLHTKQKIGLSKKG